MMIRTQVSLDSELHRRARQQADELGISLAQLTRQALERELQGPEVERSTDISAIFGLGASDGSDIAERKDEYLAAASWNEYLRQTGRASRD